MPNLLHPRPLLLIIHRFRLRLPRSLLLLLHLLNPQPLLTIPNMPLILRQHQRFLPILLQKNLIIRIRNPRRHALINALPHRIQVSSAVLVFILAGPDARFRFWVQLGETCDVDVQPVAGIDPAGVDDVHAVAAVAFARPGVDVEEVLAGHMVGAVCEAPGEAIGGGGGVRVGCVGVDRAVQVGCHVRECFAGDLGVDVPVPR